MWAIKKQNRFSHFIWRNYASSFWDDIRIDNVLPFEESKDPDDERHVHPLQLDVIERVVVLRSKAKARSFILLSWGLEASHMGQLLMDGSLSGMS